MDLKENRRGRYLRVSQTVIRSMYGTVRPQVSFRQKYSSFVNLSFVTLPSLKKNFAFCFIFICICFVILDCASSTWNGSVA